MDEYICKKCGENFGDDLNKFKGHNLKCKGKEEEVEEKPKRRRERIPLGVPRRKLTWDHQDENYEYRVFHNRPGKPNRVNDALAAGYEFVKDDRHMGDEDVSNEMGASTDSRVTHIVGEGENGEPLKGYLMRIPKEWYDEDQQKKWDIIDEREKQMMRGIDKEGKPGVGGRYLPTDASGNPISRIER